MKKQRMVAVDDDQPLDIGRGCKRLEDLKHRVAHSPEGLKLEAITFGFGYVTPEEFEQAEVASVAKRGIEMPTCSAIVHQDEI